MEKQTQLNERREMDRRRRQQKRKERLMVGYINIKHPLIYKEAEHFYNKVNSIYPEKHDLLKTPRFKELKEDRIKDKMQLRIPLSNLPNKPKETLTRKGTDQQPQIELNHEVIDQQQQLAELNYEVIDQQPPIELNHEVIDQQQQLAELNYEVIDQQPRAELNYEVNDQLPPDLNDIATTTLMSELPPELVQNIIDELRADPNLKTLMAEIQDKVANEDIDEDIDMDIDIDIPDNLLEDELLHW